MASKDARPTPHSHAAEINGSAPPEAAGDGHEAAGPSLRAQAEKITREKSSHLPENPEPLSGAGIKHSLHELQVHQVELQMQNEELRRRQEELEAARSRYFDFYDNAPVGYCSLSEQGVVKEVNLTTTTLLGVDRAELIMHPISRYILTEYLDAYHLYHKSLFENRQAQSCELKMVKKDGTVFWGELKAVAIQDAEDMPVCRVVITDITERKTAEEALRNLGAYNRSLIEANLDPLVTIDRNGKISDANPATEMVTGYLRRELIGTDFSDYFTEPDKARQGYQRVFKEGLVRDYPLEIRHHDGRITSVLYNAIVYRDDAGNISGVFASARDVTERKRTEETLKNLSSYNRSLIEANLDALVTIDPAGKIADVNSATEQATGYLRRELIGTDFSDYFTEPDKARQGYQQVFKEGLVRDYPLEIRHQDGHITSVLYNATVFRDDFGNVKGVFASARDITKRRQAEAALLETNALLSLFMKYTPVFAYIKEVGPDESRVLMASENFRDMIGIPGSAMIGMTMAQLFPAEFAEKITADDRAVVAGGKMLTLDEQLNDRYYTTIKFPVFLRDRHLLAGYTIDITERKQAEEAKEKLEALNRQLQKVESLGRMAGAVAHHFNNKLHVVMGHLELAKESLLKGNISLYNLTAATLAADKAAEVSRMMLTYLGQVSGSQESLDLAEICRNALPSIQSSMPKNAVLETVLQSPGPAIKANAGQIKQILCNLLTNAWEAAEADRQCVIHLAVKTAGPSEIPPANRYPIDWQPEERTYACLEVVDNGCGISKKDLEEVFSPFFSTKFTGRGLGLPMVLGLVQAHAGGITVESSPGKGSAFHVFLPISAEKLPIATESFEETAEFQEAGTILLVDDDEIVLDITNMMLSKLGFTVLTARDGIEALEIFRRHKKEIRLVLSDMAMPRMNGWETLITLRQIEPAIPVILASGYSEDQVMEGHHPERPQAFLGKPFGFQALRQSLRRALAGAGQEPPLGGKPTKAGPPCQAQGDFP